MVGNKKKFVYLHLNGSLTSIMLSRKAEGLDPLKP